MDKYKVRLSSPAVESYEAIRRFTAGEGGSNKSDALAAIHRLTDEIIPANPYSGVRLTVGALEGVYWISERSVHVLYDINPKILTAFIHYFVESPELVDAAREAEIIFARMCMAGRLQILPQAQGVSH